MTSTHRSAFWNRACRAKGHTGYGDPLLHKYDQPVRLTAVGIILDRLFPDGLRGRAALDIGCGTGDFIALLRRRQAKVWGVDISPEVIKGTQKRFAEDTEVHLSTGAIPELALPLNAFDVITSVTVLQHVVDDEEFVQSLRVLHSALRSDGRIVVLELAPPHPAPVEMTDSGGYVYLVERPSADWRSAFDQAGLKIVDEPVLPQLGIALLRGFGWLVKRLRSPRPLGGTKVTVAQEDDALGIPRRFKRAAFRGIKRSILFFAWPFDHLFHLPLPPAGLRHYRIFVLAAAR